MNKFDLTDIERTLHAMIEDFTFFSIKYETHTKLWQKMKSLKL